jgi:hypothetical protein
MLHLCVKAHKHGDHQNILSNFHIVEMCTGGNLCIETCVSYMLICSVLWFFYVRASIVKLHVLPGTAVCCVYLLACKTHAQSQC